MRRSRKATWGGLTRKFVIWTILCEAILKWFLFYSSLYFNISKIWSDIIFSMWSHRVTIITNRNVLAIIIKLVCWKVIYFFRWFPFVKSTILMQIGVLFNNRGKPFFKTSCLLLQHKIISESYPRHALSFIDTRETHKNLKVLETFCDNFCLEIKLNVAKLYIYNHAPTSLNILRNFMFKDKVRFVLLLV